jgi:integrase/recombinase XerD
MSRVTPNDLGRDLVSFFEDFLPAQRGLSPHTIRSYRDAMLLLLQFASKDAKRAIERLDIALTSEPGRAVSLIA